VQFAEVIYETGSHSVMSYESEDELKRALKAHHDRAVNGAPGGPTGHPAERVKSVLLYDRHPADFNPAMSMSKDVMDKEVSQALELHANDQEGAVGIEQAAAQIRRLADPLDHQAIEESPHNSMFRMPETGNLDLAFLGSDK
jgi:hypothetical protein